MPKRTDPNVLAGAALSTELRAWLRARPEGPAVQSTALMYELTALIALHAPSVDAAEALIDSWVSMAHAQVRRLGVGREHP